VSPEQDWHDFYGALYELHQPIGFKDLAYCTECCRPAPCATLNLLKWYRDARKPDPSEAVTETLKINKESL
jgi:hypothetical protein